MDLESEINDDDYSRLEVGINFVPTAFSCCLWRLKMLRSHHLGQNFEVDFLKICKSFPFNFNIL